MANYNDILLNTTTNDLQIVNGDFVVGNSAEQSVSLLLNCFPGNFKEYPTTCVGLLNYIASNSSQSTIAQIIRQALIADNFTVENCTVAPDNSIQINAVQN
jgi:hypothetical protein